MLKLIGLKIGKWFLKKFLFVLMIFGLAFGIYFYSHKETYNKINKEIIYEMKLDKLDNDMILKNIKMLYQENNDLVGYLSVLDTNINYPVMYTKKEDYYLRRNFQKLPSVGGMLFIDKYNTIEPRDMNLIIYGHNMDDGTMFADLLRYKDKEFFDSHRKAIYYSLEEREEYEVIAVFLSQVYKVSDNVFKYYKFYNARTIEELNDYITNISSLNLYDNEINANLEDKFITLSTCEYSKENGRLAVILKKM